MFIFVFLILFIFRDCFGRMEYDARYRYNQHQRQMFMKAYHDEMQQQLALKRTNVELLETEKKLENLRELSVH